MKISVETNKNIIFFEIVLSLLKDDNDYHPLGVQAREVFSDIRDLKAFKDFKIARENKEIPSHPWQYFFLSINLNDDLTPKSLSPQDGFGPNREDSYIKDIQPLVSDIHKKSNFDKRYKESVLPAYMKVVQNIQSLFEKEDPASILEEFWKSNIETQLIFIPDFLRVGGGSGVSRENDFYSITGTVRSEEGIIFKPSHMISNSLHEYSHSFFKRHLYNDMDLMNENNYLCEKLASLIDQDKFDDKILKNYGKSAIYFEEMFIRAVQILLSRRFFEKKMSEDLSEKALSQLDKRKEEGFIYIEDFYRELDKNKLPMEVYINVLGDIYKDLS